MRRTKIIALISAIIFMIFLAVWVLGSGGGSKVEVVVADKNISENTIITKESLKTVKVNEDIVIPNAVKDKDEVVGKLSNSTIYKGEMIPKNRIASKNDKDSSQYGLAQVIGKGKRGMSILVNLPRGVSHLLKVGNYVDIGYTGEINKRDGTTMLFQDIKVIALESNYANSSSSDDKINKYTTVTLELTPQEFIKLVYALEHPDKDNKDNGVWLALRPQGEHGKVRVKTVRGIEEE